MSCQYPDCADEAGFSCLCEGEETRLFCHAHMLKGVEICELLGWTLSVERIEGTEARAS